MATSFHHRKDTLLKLAVDGYSFAPCSRRSTAIKVSLDPECSPAIQAYRSISLTNRLSAVAGWDG